MAERVPGGGRGTAGSAAGPLQVHQVLSPLLGARCTVLAGSAGCVVVDAGALVADEVERVVRATGRPPRAVLATHGHLDHVWDAGVLADRLDVPVVLHPDDRYRLDDPVGTLGLPVELLGVAGLDVGGYRPPSDVRTLDDPSLLALLDLGGVRVEPLPAPGHTEGSTLYLLASPDARPLVLTGDVLFAGSVGRTDLPGGDGAAMARTLRTVVARLEARTVLLPGHGPTTDLATELATNPYLRPAR